METFGDGASILLIPVGYALFAFGLLAFALGQITDTARAVSTAGVISLAFAFLKWHGIANNIMARWTATNRLATARNNTDAAHFEFMASAFVPADSAISDDAGHVDPIAEAGEDGPPIVVNTTKGSYSMPRLTEAEARENALIGECLLFLSMGRKARKFSCRAMTPYRRPGQTEKAFEAWWTLIGDQLVAWGLFAKVEKSGTRPLKPVEEIRTALLRREFKKPLETVA